MTTGTLMLGNGQSGSADAETGQMSPITSSTMGDDQQAVRGGRNCDKAAEADAEEDAESTPMIPTATTRVVEAASEVDVSDQPSASDMNGNHNPHTHSVVNQHQQHPPKPPSENSHLLARVMKFPLTSCRPLLADRSLRVDLLAILFGIGSWVGVNSVYLQLPLIVAHAPEGWSLPSFLVIIIQIGNVGPLLYTLTQRWSPRKLNDSYLIYGIYAIGAAAAICMATMYTWTAVVAGEERSVALLAITFFFAFIGCTSSVLFMPYMGRFKECYLITYLVGEGLSGFLPSLLALAQGVGGNTVCVPTGVNGTLESYTPPPRFQSDVFFWLIFALMAVSAVAFVLLDRLALSRRQYASVQIRHGNDYKYGTGLEGSDGVVIEADAVNGKEQLKRSDSQAAGADVAVLDGKKAAEASSPQLSPALYVCLMVVMAVVSLFGSGIYPSIQSYSCLPYGNLAYHLTVTLSSIANPAACFMAIFLPHQSLRQIGGLCGVMAALTAYALATAVLSPEPPLVQTVGGEVLVIITWVVLTGLVSYIKLSITSIFRYQGGQSLVWIGASSQVGSAIGAIISFCLVNMTGIFVAYQAC